MPNHSLRRWSAAVVAALLLAMMAVIPAVSADTVTDGAGASSRSGPPIADPIVPARQPVTQAALDAAMMLWTANEPADYVYSYRTICFCPYLPIVTVTIVNGAVVSAVDAFGNAPSSVLSISDMFAEIQDGVDNADMAFANFDLVNGRPLDYYINWDVGIADEETNRVVHGFAEVIGPVTCLVKQATVVLTEAAEYFDAAISSRFGETMVIAALGGDDIISLGAERDIVCGGDGDDYMWGGPGNDVLIGGTGDDNLLGGDGNDVLVGGAGEDELFGQLGADDLRGGGGKDLIYGSAGPDIIRGDGGADRIYGGPGWDVIAGGSGPDRIWGGSGFDTIEGGPGNDRLSGGRHGDQVHGGPGDDFVRGSGGFDTVHGDAGNDVVWGESGDDLVYGGSGNDALNGGPGTDFCDPGTGTNTTVNC